MKNQRTAIILITGITTIIGLMIAAQYQTYYEPNQSESRDISQLRQQLREEMERHQQLLSDLSKYELLLYEYETSVNETDQLSVMREELEQVKAFAGVKAVSGPGIIITIQNDPSMTGGPDLPEGGQGVATVVVDEDLRTLVNELFYNGAKAISINGRRLTATSAIRSIGGQIQVDTYPVTMPYHLKVIGDPDTLISTIKVTGMHEYFQVINKVLTVQKRENLVVPPFDGDIEIRYMEPASGTES
ncbi:MAG: DUF881 domain-containing protein [Bacillaceae bacterium]|nr:DUF881 domain-containing protein [Bacillaceae bacterium]